MVEKTDTPETAGDLLEVTQQVQCRARSSDLSLHPHTVFFLPHLDQITPSYHMG